MEFIIKDEEGLKYAQISGDKNEIHLDNLTGYNSNFGHKICHGTLVLIKTLKLLNINNLLLNKKKFNLRINFSNYFIYNKKILINKTPYKIFQKNGGSAELQISNNSEKKKFNFKNYKKFEIKLFKNFKSNINHLSNITILLNALSKYVGMIYPGKYSIISDISLNFNENSYFYKSKIIIYSKKKYFPIIQNKLYFKNYEVDFNTLERPKLKLNKDKIKKDLLEKVKKIKDPILIIGSSSGIGLELLKLFERNKKIKIYATYNQNKIKNIKKNVKLIKLDLKKNINLLKKIILPLKNLRIYYMATSKINVKDTSKSGFKNYQNFYINFPIKILSFSKKNNIQFFYPSTEYINTNKSSYSIVKKIGEKKLLKLNKNNFKINILRIPEVNTKQNLSILKKNLPSFIKLLNKNLNFQKKILFF